MATPTTTGSTTLPGTGAAGAVPISAIGGIASLLGIVIVAIAQPLGSRLR